MHTYHNVLSEEKYDRSYCSITRCWPIKFVLLVTMIERYGDEFCRAIIKCRLVLASDVSYER